MNTASTFAAAVPSAPAAQSPATARSVRQRAAVGAAWVFLAFAASKVLAVATTFVLARLLPPEDFGLVSFSMVLIGAFAILQDLGVPAAIVYTGRKIEDVAGTALTINVLAATVLLAGAVAAAPVVAQLGGSPHIAPLLMVLAATLVISSVGSVQAALLTKELEFRRKFVPDVVPLLASGAVSISAAIAGAGAWSLVYGHLARVTTSTALLWARSSIRPRPEFRWPVAVDLLKYGKHVSVTSVTGFAAANIDYLIVGYTLGPAALGVYTVAYNLANLPATSISQVVMRTSFPSFTKLRDDLPGLRRLFLTNQDVVALLSIPAALGLFVCAPVLAGGVLGERWAGVTDPLRILVLFGALRAMGQNFGPIYKAMGRPDFEWWFVLVKLLSSAPLMLWAARFGVEGVAAIQVITGGMLLPISAHFVSRLIGLSRRDWWERIGPQLLGLVPACGLVLLAQYALSDPGTRAGRALPMTLALYGIAAAATGAAYVITMATLQPRLAGRIRSGFGSAAALLRSRR